MRRKGTIFRLCTKCGGELCPPRRANANILGAEQQHAEAVDVGEYTCVVCGISITPRARRESDFRRTLTD